MAETKPGSELDWEAFTVEALQARQGQGERPYLEFLRVPSLSAGVYVLPAGAVDRQRPHGQDEMYYVVAGKARFWAAKEEEAIAVGPGAVLYVKAGVPHKFIDVTEALTVVVFFAPAEVEE